MSPVAGQYDQAVDRESAFEILRKKGQAAADAAAQRQAEPQRQAQPQGRSAEAPSSDSGSGWSIPGFGSGNGRRQSVAEAAIKSVVRSVGSQVGRALVRGILGSLTRR
jgi:hypothetical protein